MCDYIKEEIFLEEDPNPHLLEKEITIEDVHGFDVIKEEYEAKQLELHYASQSVENTNKCHVCSKTFTTHSNEKKYNCSECESPFTTKSTTPFQCEECPRSFSVLSLLKKHYVSHNQEKPYKCDRCSIACKWKGNLKKHKAVAHDNEGKFSCEVCGKKFMNRSHFETHKMRHSEEKNHKCEECGCAFKLKGNLIRHIGVLHPTATPFQCEVCSKSFSKLSFLKIHSASHAEEKPFKCDQCPVACKRKNSLDKHKAMVHDSEGKYPCKVCGKKFTIRTYLKVHLKSHSKEKNHKCNECGCAFKLKGNLIRHIGTFHPITTPFRCEVCSKSFSTLSLLKIHSVCHKEERSHKCDQCSNAYKYKSHLDTHKVTVHDSEGRYPCEQCGKKFSFPAKLKMHMLKHSSEKKHKCGECGYTSKRKGDLTKHVSIVHPTETPFQCEVCLKSFSKLSYLTVHLLTHSDDRPYQCEICQNVFKTNRILNQHKKHIHGALKIELDLVSEVKVESAVIYDTEEKRVLLDRDVEVKQEVEEMDTY